MTLLIWRTWYGFAIAPPGLEIQNLQDPYLSEDVMTASDPLLETQCHKKPPDVIKPDVGVGPADQNST